MPFITLKSSLNFFILFPFVDYYHYTYNKNKIAQQCFPDYFVSVIFTVNNCCQNLPSKLLANHYYRFHYRSNKTLNKISEIIIYYHNNYTYVVRRISFYTNFTRVRLDSYVIFTKIWNNCGLVLIFFYFDNYVILASNVKEPQEKIIQSNHVLSYQQTMSKVCTKYFFYFWRKLTK